MLNKELANKITEIAIKQYETGMNFKKKRMEDIQKSEDFYYGRKTKSLVNKEVARLPIMSGFVDTLLSKIDDPPIVNFGWQNIADYKRAIKVQAAWERDAGTNYANWSLKDRWEKKLAIFSGRGISKVYAESDPEYRARLDVVDYKNFYCEPKGGGHLRNHLFKGEQNIWRTKHELIINAKKGIYDLSQVNKLLSALGNEDYKKNNDIYSGDIERYRSLGLDMENNSYVGIPIVRLVEHYMAYNGVWYYVLFEYSTGIWIRAELLKDVFESGEDPYVSWATHPDAGNFWSKAPADDVRPLADIIDSLFTQELQNRRKRNAAMRGWDPEMIPFPSQLNYRPDGLVQIKRREGGSIKDAVFEFETPELRGTIDLVNYIDGMIGLKTGITPAAQGEAEAKTVGVYFGNLQQVADRLGLYNKSYKEAWAEKGLKYYWGLREHCPEKMMVKIIGSEGIEWDELTEDDLNPLVDFDITITGGVSEQRMNEIKNRNKKDALLMIQKDKELSAMINPQWRLKQILTIAGWEEDEIKVALDRGEKMDLGMISDAERVIQEIIKGKEPAIIRGANTAFLQYLLDWAYSKINFNPNDKDRVTKEKKKIFDGIIGYIKKMTPIVAENMARKAMREREFNIENINTKEVKEPEKTIEEGITPEAPGMMPPTPEGEIMSRSQKISRLISGKQEEVNL